MYRGRYLGPAIDVAPALTENIWNSNFEVIHCSSYLSLLPEEVNDENELRCQFDAMI